LTSNDENFDAFHKNQTTIYYFELHKVAPWSAHMLLSGVHKNGWTAATHYTAAEWYTKQASRSRCRQTP